MTMGLFSKKSAPQPSARPEYIEVGQIVNTHGVRGEVKVQPWDVSPELLCGFKTFYMDGAPFRPTSKRVQGDMVLSEAARGRRHGRCRRAQAQGALHPPATMSSSSQVSTSTPRSSA
ncbi:MAG: hypothetical protein ACLRSD_04470 [Oscillibacter sp.]